MKNNKLLPVIIQNYKDKDVLMLGYMNQEALQITKETGMVWFWSRSRNKLWQKGEKSGNKFKIKNFFIDCDRDTLLINVELIGKYACHKGTKTCFTNFT